MSSFVIPTKTKYLQYFKNILIYNKITSWDHLPRTCWTPPSLNPLVEEPEYSVQSRSGPHERTESLTVIRKMTKNTATNPLQLNTHSPTYETTRKQDVYIKTCCLMSQSTRG